MANAGSTANDRDTNTDNKMRGNMNSSEAIDLRVKRTSPPLNLSFGNGPRATFKDRRFRGKHASIFKKHKLRYRSSLTRQLRQTSDSGQFGSGSMRGSSSMSMSSLSKRSFTQGETSTQGETTSSHSMSTSPSSGSGSSNSPQSFEPQVNVAASTDQRLCMMLGHAVPLIVMMQGQMHTTNSGNNDISYSSTMLFKCNMCDMFSNNITDVLNHVNNNHSNIHYCFMCSQFYPNKKEFDRHKDVCASTRQAFQQMMGGQYHDTNATHSNVQNEAMNLSVIGNVAKRAAQMVHGKKSKRKKLNTLLKCMYCKKAFFGRFYLQRHLRSHTGEKACHCDICGKGFAEWRNLRNHMKRFHNGSETMTSQGGQSKSVSPNITSDSDQLHHKTHTKQSLWRAGNNNFSYPSHSVTGNYSNLATDATQPNADYPDLSVSEPQLAKVHHQPGNEDATQVLSSQTDFIQVGAPSGLQKTEVTTDKVDRVVGRMFHESMPHNSSSCSSGNYSPTVCTTSVSQSGYSLARAVDRSSTESSTTILIHSLPETQLSEDIKSLDGMSVTQPITSEAQESRAKSEDIKTGTMYLGSTSSRLELTNEVEGHEQSLNPICNENGEKVFQCHACSKIFKSKFAMQRHLDFHADKRPYECSQCNYKAKTRPQLKVHVMRHSGEKEHTCNICNYSCVTHSDLNRHCKSRTHRFRVDLIQNGGGQPQEQLPSHSIETSETQTTSANTSH